MCGLYLGRDSDIKNKLCCRIAYAGPWQTYSEWVMIDHIHFHVNKLFSVAQMHAQLSFHVPCTPVSFNVTNVLPSSLHKWRYIWKSIFVCVSACASLYGHLRVLLCARLRVNPSEWVCVFIGSMMCLSVCLCVCTCAHKNSAHHRQIVCNLWLCVMAETCLIQVSTEQPVGYSSLRWHQPSLLLAGWVFH